MRYSLKTIWVNKMKWKPSRQSILIIAVLGLIACGIIIAYHEGAVVPRRQLRLVHLGMSRDEVRLAVGAPSTSNLQPAIPPDSDSRGRSGGHSMAMGTHDGCRSADLHHFGWSFYRFYFDQDGHLIGVARDMD